MKSLSVSEFENEINNGAMILDTRVPDEFAKGFVGGSLNIGLNGSYAIWAGTLLDISTPLVLVALTGKEKESIMRLARVGFDNVKGFLNGGFVSWVEKNKPVEIIQSVDPQKFYELLDDNNKEILDVRRSGEFETSHVKNSMHIPLAELPARLNELDASEEYMIYCRTGYRSMIAASLLKSRGFNSVINVKEGMVGISRTNAAVESGAAVSN